MEFLRTVDILHAVEWKSDESKLGISKHPRKHPRNRVVKKKEHVLLRTTIKLETSAVSDPIYVILAAHPPTQICFVSYESMTVELWGDNYIILDDRVLPTRQSYYRN